MKRITLARVSAAFGAACLLLVPTALAARADTAPLPIYSSTGVGKGIMTTFALTPSIFNPLIELGTNYTTTSISSQGDGQSHSLAALTFPGSLAVGFLGCPAVIPIPGFETPIPGLVQASYPSTATCPKEAHRNLFSIPLQSGNDDFDAAVNSLAQFMNIAVGDMRAKADEGVGAASVATQSFLLQGGSSTPILSVGSLDVGTNALRAGKTVENIVTAKAKNISLLGGVLQIGSMVSTSRASSDGTAGDAKGTLTIADATMLVNGERHQVTIDNEGIHATDPGLSRAQNIGLSEKISDLLVDVGIEITTATPTKIIEGASSEASVGGLVITFDVSVPPVSVPQEVAGVIADALNGLGDLGIELTHCLTEFQIPAPLCFGPGVLPGPGSHAHMTFNIGSTDAFAVGGLGFTDSFGGGCTTCSGGPLPPTTVLPTFNTQPSGPSLPSVAPAPQTQTGPLQLFGLVAKLPAILLLWLGVGLLLLAVASAFGPSLRHARPH